MASQVLKPLFLIAIFIAAFISPYPVSSREVKPKELYRLVWQTVRDNYYDRSFNGQDWSTWQHKFDSRLSTETEANAAIKEMLASLGEPFTRHITREETEQNKRQAEARMIGIGVQLGQNNDNNTCVIAAFENTPAFRAGIQSGDIISRVNGEDMKGQSLDAVVSRIRGPVGTPVTLTLLRGGQPVEFTVQRAQYEIKANTDSEILPGNIGYIRIENLATKNSFDEFMSALASVRAADGLIVDLRNCPGGFMEHCLNICGTFLGEGPLLVTMQFGNNKTEVKRSTGRQVTDQPLLVLINEGTSFGAELIAAALRDNGRCRLVGQRSFGKSLIQNIFNLPDGSGLSISIGSYLSPKNRQFTGGLEPDFIVPLTHEDLKAGKGPWWVSRVLTGKGTPEDKRDLQLGKAALVLRNEIAMKKGLPPIGEAQPEQVATSAVAPARPATGKNRPVKDKWALVVGISEFKKGSLNLKFPAKDARDFAGFLTSSCHFAPDHVRVLTNEQATRANILNDLGDKWLPRVVRPDDLVVLYFSTHGSPSDLDIGGVNYLIAHDTDPESLYSSGLPMQDLVRIIKGRIRSDRVVVVLDACYSGNVDPQSKGIYKQANINVEEVAQGTGQLVISSSAPDQVSWESKEQSNSVFTRHLMNALRSNGDMTRLGDAFKVLKDRVEEEVQRDRGKLQTPVLRSKWEGNELMLAVPPSEPRPGLKSPAD
ncbi:MAG: caspase family protein [Candidatus Melainabacteria bacterium]|nr:caspase family protein [Candidatus Melainabacteria bacterium]